MAETICFRKADGSEVECSSSCRPVAGDSVLLLGGPYRVTEVFWAHLEAGKKKRKIIALLKKER